MNLPIHEENFISKITMYDSNHGPREIHKLKYYSHNGKTLSKNSYNSFMSHGYYVTVLL